MKTRWLATTALLLLLPAAAGAAEQLDLDLDYGLQTQAGWTDNVYGTSDDAQEDPISDWSLRLSPWGKASDLDGDLTWSMRYKPTYEYYLQEYDSRGFDHDADGELSWRVGDRTVLTATNTFAQYNSLVRFNENTGTSTDPAVLRNQRDKVLSNLLTLGLRHHLTPRDIFLVNGAYNFRDYSDDSSTDRWTTTLDTTYQHTLSERTTLGVRGAWIQQTFARDFGSDVVTNYYNLSALFDHRFSRTLSLELSAGPTLIDGDEEVVSFAPEFGVRAVGATTVAVDANDCPLLNDSLPAQPDPDVPNYNPHVTGFGFVECGVSSTNAVTPGELALLGYPNGPPLEPGSSLATQNVKLTEFKKPFEQDSSGALVPFDDTGFGSSEVTYFARAALIKDWELWHAQLAYERSNDDSGSFGASSVQDSFEGTLRWEPSPLWSVSLTGVYSLIDQASDIAIPTGLVVENGPVPAGVDSVSQIATVPRRGGLVVQADSNAVSYTTASVSLSASRRLTRLSSAFFALYWYQQDQQLDLPNDLSFVPASSSRIDDESSWSTLTLWIGLDWHFDTLKF